MTLREFLARNGGELLGLTFEHLILVLVSTGIAILIGVPLGILRDGCGCGVRASFGLLLGFRWRGVCVLLGCGARFGSGVLLANWRFLLCFLLLPPVVAL